MTCFLFLNLPRRKGGSVMCRRFFKGQRKNLKSCERFCACVVDSFNEATGWVHQSNGEIK